MLPRQRASAVGPALWGGAHTPIDRTASHLAGPHTDAGTHQSGLRWGCVHALTVPAVPAARRE